MFGRFCLIFVFWNCMTDLGLSQEEDNTKNSSSIVKKGAPLIERQLRDIQEFRSQRHIWDRAVRGFRQDHNFAITSGLDFGIWSGHVGSKEQGFEFASAIPFINLYYSFHLVLLRDFGIGYFVGTRSRLFFLEKAEIEDFDRPRLYGLPGALGGLTWNISPVLRLSLGIDGAPIRLERFLAPNQTEGRSQVSATAQVISYRISGDFFFKLGTGLNLEYEIYRLTYDSSNNVRLRRRGESWSVGFIWHLI